MGEISSYFYFASNTSDPLLSQDHVTRCLLLGECGDPMQSLVRKEPTAIVECASRYRVEANHYNFLMRKVFIAILHEAPWGKNFAVNYRRDLKMRP